MSQLVENQLPHSVMVLHVSDVIAPELLQYDLNKIKNE